jgi:ectoine hydroxylase-related dioxygenase (phytanoyl-CoA dioxygenase family)
LDDEISVLCLKRVVKNTFFDDRGEVIVMSGLDHSSDVIFEISRHKDLVDVARCLLRSSAIPLHVEFFAKPPRTFHVTPAHQDVAFYENYRPNKIVTLWIALSDVTKLSGALQFASRLPKCILPHHKSSGAFAYEVIDLPEVEFEPIELPCGGCIAHNSWAIHRSGPNETAYTRKAIAFCYRASIA